MAPDHQWPNFLNFKISASCLLMTIFERSKRLCIWIPKREIKNELVNSSSQFSPRQTHPIFPSHLRSSRARLTDFPTDAMNQKHTTQVGHPLPLYYTQSWQGPSSSYSWKEVGVTNSQKHIFHTLTEALRKTHHQTVIATPRPSILAVVEPRGGEHGRVYLLV